MAQTKILEVKKQTYSNLELVVDSPVKVHDILTIDGKEYLYVTECIRYGTQNNKYISQFKLKLEKVEPSEIPSVKFIYKPDMTLESLKNCGNNGSKSDNNYEPKHEFVHGVIVGIVGTLLISLFINSVIGIIKLLA